MPLPLASTTTPCGVARYTASRCGQFYNWKWFSHRDKKPYFNAELTSRHGEKESEMLKNNGKAKLKHIKLETPPCSLCLLNMRTCHKTPLLITVGFPKLSSSPLLKVKFVKCFKLLKTNPIWSLLCFFGQIHLLVKKVDLWLFCLYIGFSNKIGLENFPYHVARRIQVLGHFGT